MFFLLYNIYLVTTVLGIYKYISFVLQRLSHDCSRCSVVATTRWNGTCSLLTSAKLSVGYLVVRITRELDKEPSLHCSSIYINTRWSVLQQCVYLMSYYSSTMLLPQDHHAMFMCPDIILFRLCYHACTMYTP